MRPIQEWNFHRDPITRAQPPSPRSSWCPRRHLYNFPPSQPSKAKKKKSIAEVSNLDTLIKRDEDRNFNNYSLAGQFVWLFRKKHWVVLCDSSAKKNWTETKNESRFLVTDTWISTTGLCRFSANPSRDVNPSSGVQNPSKLKPLLKPLLKRLAF